MYKEQIDKYIEDNYENMKEDLASLIKIDSSLSQATDKKPFGEGAYEAVKYAEKMLSKMGFFVKNHENYMLEANYFNSTEAKLGIIGHLDVVPRGDGWSYEPFKLTEENGKLFGRGVIDDKGPMVAAIYGLKALKDLGIPLKENVKVLLGSDEETGMQDLEYYRKRFDFPEKMLSPDAEFPVVNVEKGICQVVFEGKYNQSENGIVSIHCDNVINAVPGKATAKISGVSEDSIINAHSVADVTTNLEIEVDGEEITITSTGVSAHGSLPENGDNALTGLIKVILEINELSDTSEYKFLEKLYSLFPYNEGDGKSMGLKSCDEISGALSLTYSLLDLENGNLNGGFDIRFPVSRKLSEITDIVDDKLEILNVRVTVDHGLEGHCVDGNSDFIKTLVSTYADISGNESECVALGGATYVHTIEGGVGFGAEVPGEENNMHSSDENISVATFKLIAKVYANAIYRLCGE